ncbi:unnamed protein product [Spirodela intermedia]|uniref:Rieske domain-containing protein n=1 Tax=Spirodela intermedia TaxID=51605 RepID=A0A7I8IXE9_SPIIN|nr:unnamed protein product [Spirodela intermedia]CAA6662265.1 unnamed protein product [Spirodela intermedia]
MAAAAAICRPSSFCLSFSSHRRHPSSAAALSLSRRWRKAAGGCRAALAEDLGRRSSPSEDRSRDQEALLPNEAAAAAAPTEATAAEAAAAEYDWREEWYPLYLTAEMPDDAPLGLTVFHKQLVVYRDGGGVIRCYEDRCPHRLAKLSEGQLVDGRLECLYHGWQFEGDGHCLPEGAKIPLAACAKTYEVRDSQGVLWVWMSEKNPPQEEKLPWFEHYARPGFHDLSTIHELPYDHSILLENLMDPAHVPISHDRTDWTARREDAQPLVFSLRFSAPCVLQNNVEFVDKNGVKQYLSALFLCRPTGQGKSMLIVRFGDSTSSLLVKLMPKWFLHQNAGKVFEQDMGFLSSQNEVLMREKKPTGELYLNLRSSDVWVAEYRRWMDSAGAGMPYYFGHRTLSLPEQPAVVEQAAAGMVAAAAAAAPAKGGVGTIHAPNLVNRYFRHVVHCKSCRKLLGRLEVWRRAMVALAMVAVAAAVVAAAAREWKGILLGLAGASLAVAYACSAVVSLMTTNFVRTHRRL